MSTVTAATRTPFGELLRAWRGTRRRSQESLAFDAGVSPRHLSCVETGRAQPSRELVLRLASVLEVPLREQNALLVAAGYAPVFGQTDWDAEEMAPVRQAVEFLLERHEPYGAIAVDSAWNVRRANGGALRLLSAFAPGGDPALLGNLMRLLFHPDGLRHVMEDWDVLAPELLERAAREALAEGPNGPAARVLGEVRAYHGVARLQRPRTTAGPLPLVLPLTLRKGSLRVKLFSTITTLGTPADVTAQELRVETWFPADAATDAWWRS